MADLGVAKAMLHASGLTQVVGTPAYMAPEQATGGTIDARADVHALAAVAYQMLTGRLARDGSIAELAHASLPLAPSRIDPSLPAEVDEVLLRSLDPAPEARYSSIETFVDAFRSALPVTVAPPRRPSGHALPDPGHDVRAAADGTHAAPASRAADADLPAGVRGGVRCGVRRDHAAELSRDRRSWTNARSLGTLKAWTGRATLSNFVAGVGIAVVVALLAWLVTDRYAAARQAQAARQARNLAAAEELYTVYGHFFAAWKGRGEHLQTERWRRRGSSIRARVEGAPHPGQ